MPEFVAVADALGTTMQEMLIRAMTPKEACDKVQDVAVHSYETSRLHQAAWARPSWSARTWAGVR